MLWAYLAGAIHAEDDLVREPVRTDVHDGREEKCHHEPLRAPGHVADDQEDAAQKPEQEGRLQSICHSLILPVQTAQKSCKKRGAPGKIREHDVLVQRVCAVSTWTESIQR